MDIAGRGASFGSTVINLTHNVIGAGFVSLAFTLTQTGMLGGLALMAFVAWLNVISCYYITLACENRGVYDFTQLGGNVMGVAYQVFGTLYAIGSCISYVVLTADLITGAYPSFGRNAVTRWSVGMFFVLSLYRRLESFKFVSSIGLICVLYTSITVMVFTNDGGDGDVNWGVPPLSGVMVALPMVSVAFTCHYNVPRFLEEMEHPWRFTKAAVVAFASSFVIYAMVSASAYARYGHRVRGDLMQSLPDTLGVRLAELSLGFLTIAEYPLVFNFVRRSSLHLMRFKEDGLPAGAYELITLSLVLLTYGIAVCVPKVEVILGYKGALFGSFLVYIFPGVLAWREFKGQKKHIQGAGALLFSSFGLLVLVLGTWYTTVRLMSPKAS